MERIEMTHEALTELNRKIAVMEASKAQEIQFQRGYSGEWSDVEGPSWDWVKCDYRVKAKEPQRLYASAAGGIYCTPTGVVMAEYIELTPEIRKALNL